MTENVKWWTKDGDTSARAAIQLIQQINAAQVWFHQDNLRHLRMYENRDYLTSAVSSHMVKTYSQARRSVSANRTAKMALNVSKAVIDTIVAKLGKERVKPVFLTSGGILERRNQCQKLNDWIFGQFISSGLYTWNKQTLRHACVFGKGGIKSFIQMRDGKPKVCCEPVFTPEILVDPYDAYYGTPQCLYQQKFVTKDLLREDETFGKRAYAIDAATTISGSAGTIAHDATVVWEAWRIKGKSVGKHMIFTDAGVLFEEDWNSYDFPIDFMDYTKPSIGFFGIGVCEELVPIQIEINRIAQHIKDSMILCSNPRTYVPIGANIDKNHLTNKIGGIVPFAGSNPPITVPGNGVASESFMQLDNLYNKGFELPGVSQMSATGRNTLGASASGEAIRSYVDVESDRFSELQQNWEDLHVRVAERQAQLARQIVKEYGHYIVSMPDPKRGILDLDFADIDPGVDNAVIQCFPQSALPKQPGPRLASIKELKDEGYIDGDTARDLVDFPDIQGQMRYLTAPRRVIEQSLEKMAYQETPKNGRWLQIIPEPYMNVAYGLQLGTAFYNYLLLELPEDTSEQRDEKDQRLNLIRQWIDRCNELGNMGAETPAEGITPEMAAAPGMPQGDIDMTSQGPVGMPRQALSDMQMRG